MRTNFLLVTILVFFSQLSIAQVGIGTTLPDPSSELDVSSPLNDKGVLIPRMTQAQRNLIISPATSLLIYQTDNTPGFYYYNGTIWVGLTAGASTDWTLLGNTGTTSATNFFGTTDDNDIVFRRNNIRSGFIGNPIAAPLTTLNRRNTSFGANSLLNPAGGFRNTAIGTNVMAGNTSGNRNVAVGDAAMSSNTTGQQNVAIGVGSLFSNQLGNSNVAIGRNALTSTNGTTGTQASNNTAVGMVSMESNTTGAYNSAFGRESLYSNSTGDYNVGVGWKAGLANTVGINNVSIGNSAGVASTGSNNITIGSFSEVPVLANSNQLSIGNVIYGKNMTSTFNGLIGIGENDPISKLHVNSGGPDLNGIYNEYLPNTNTSSLRAGFNNIVSGNTTDAIFGTYNNVSNSGTGAVTGWANQITGSTGNISLTGNNTVITGESDITGNNNLLTNNSTLTSSVSSYNSNLAGTSNGTIKGTNTSIDVSGTGNHYGNYNLLAGNGNTVSGSGHYGTFNLLNGTGTTNKYGSYNRINTAAGGTHFGVYSEVLKAGATNFAGYFLGNVGIGTTVANTYILPTSRASTTGQIMQSNATGIVTWQTPAAALNSAAWLTTGNSGMASNFLGTTDANPLIFSTSNTERMRIYPTGEILVGTGTPFADDKVTVFATGALAYAVSGYSTLTGSGIFGQNTGTGTGVYGSNTSTGIGVEGDSTTSGIGVLGINDGSGFAVQGNNRSTGYGVAGFSSGTNGAVYGQANVVSGIGVRGSTNGAGGFGVLGISSSGTGNTGGVWGRGTGTTNGTGVIGAGNTLLGIVSTSGSGGSFTGTSFGTVSFGTTNASGVGIAASGNSVGNTLLNTFGAGGAFSANRYGVTSFAAITGAANNATDRAAFLGQYTSVGTTIDNVHVGARIAGVNYKILGTGGGSVATTMPTSQGERIMFAPEATENWFFDMGEVQLINGKATVTLDPIFVETISDLKPFKVFVQGAENTLGTIKVTRNQKDKTFELEDMGGQSNGVVQFSIYAIWKGKENLRMPIYDSNLKYQSKTMETNNLKQRTFSDEVIIPKKNKKK
ncbi:beta strand repeat-containing protein [Flavobacterium sp.]|jgi:hypothetical protein|uniref:beta strand repeat-containing protein n=1 Tax=Flavobacterium sp. TaxID=239 RepID=UPI0037BE9375